MKRNIWKYRKIPIISPGAFIFQRPFLRGLFLEGLIYGGKFASQNRGGFFALPVWRAYIILEGLIHGGAYFRNFTVTVYM